METLVRKFPCPRCGADVVWHPGEERLVCQYCGYRGDATPLATVAAGAAVGAAGDSAFATNVPPVAEQALEDGLSLPQRVGWGVERKAYRCAKCGAVETLDPNLVAGACAFCGTPAVAEAATDPNLVQPAGVLPFSVERGEATGRFRGWLSSLWFRPNNLKRIASLESIRGVYVPFWTFDAKTVSHWTAEAGYHRGSGKNRRTEWRQAAGVLDHDFDDLPVPASRGIDADLARALEPFPTAQLKAYDPNYLSGFVAEQYGVDLPTAWSTAKTRMDATLLAACRNEVPGDTCRNLRVRTDYSARTYKSGLLPIWIAAYTYRGDSFRYVVNGATGQAAGTAPWSWVKISLAVAAILTIVLFVIANS